MLKAESSHVGTMMEGLALDASLLPDSGQVPSPPLPVGPDPDRAVPVPPACHTPTTPEVDTTTAGLGVAQSPSLPPSRPETPQNGPPPPVFRVSGTIRLPSSALSMLVAIGIHTLFMFHV